MNTHQYTFDIAPENLAAHARKPPNMSNGWQTVNVAIWRNDEPFVRCTLVRDYQSGWMLWPTLLFTKEEATQALIKHGYIKESV
jgi:hypothetical protein